MDKPTAHSTVKYMKEYIRDKGLNKKKITLGLKRADMIEALTKLGHYDKRHDGVKKPSKIVRLNRQNKQLSQKRPTIGKVKEARPIVEKYISLQKEYKKKFADSKLKKYKDFKTLKAESDKLLEEALDLIQPIYPQILTEVFKTIKGSKKLRFEVKGMSNSLEERFEENRYI